jgi:hypothetical protein
MTSLRFRLTYKDDELRFRLTNKDDEPEVVCLLCPGQLGQEWGTQVSHHHEKGDRGSRQVTNDSKLENKANYSYTKIFSAATIYRKGSRPKNVIWQLDTETIKLINNLTPEKVLQEK